MMRQGLRLDMMYCAASYNSTFGTSESQYVRSSFVSLA
jgi:hypothetical protein